LFRIHHSPTTATTGCISAHDRTRDSFRND
jgi:hypothetical protein